MNHQFHICFSYKKRLTTQGEVEEVFDSYLEREEKEEKEFINCLRKKKLNIAVNF